MMIIVRKGPGLYLYIRIGRSFGDRQGKFQGSHCKCGEDMTPPSVPGQEHSTTVMTVNKQLALVPLHFHNLHPYIQDRHLIVLPFSHSSSCITTAFSEETFALL